jgi:hypothetical protein
MGKIFNHTKAGDLGSFIIGDVVLSIPPSAITTTRIENNEEITSLRSRFPMIRKTGQSIMMATVMWQAVLENNGIDVNYTEWEKLVRIYATFKSAPFVEVQNEHLRTVLHMEGNYNRMVFALKNLTISTSPDSTDILEAKLDMFFFNFMPYSKDFAYTDDLGSGKFSANNKKATPYKDYIDMWIAQNIEEDPTYYGKNDTGMINWRLNNTGNTEVRYSLYKFKLNTLKY